MTGLTVPRTRIGASIIVVSGLPRSGTSMTMQMLAAGGIPVMTDGLRQADASNPRGYLEMERAKALDQGRDTAWLGEADGKAVKVISFLLPWLPERFDYKVLFIRRNIEDIVASQVRMFDARGERAELANPARMRDLYAEHLDGVFRLLARRRCFRVLEVEYEQVLHDPEEQSRRFAEFLERELDTRAMAMAVEPSLRHHRTGYPAAPGLSRLES